jgi:hypothetical protein
MTAFAGFIAIIGAIAVGVSLVGAVGTWIVGPMDKAARNIRAPTQFYVTDAFGLALLLQLATLVPAWMIRNSMEATASFFVGALLWGATAVIWWASIGAMSRAGVRKLSKRFVFSVVVLPLALGCIMGPIIITGLLVGAVGRIAEHPAEWPSAALLAGAEVLVFGLAYVGRRATLWVLSDPATEFSREP